MRQDPERQFGVVAAILAVSCHHVLLSLGERGIRGRARQHAFGLGLPRPVDECNLDARSESGTKTSAATGVNWERKKSSRP
jgi:hypothetical protein